MFWVQCQFLNSLYPLPWFVCVHVCACMYAVILQIILFLHHRFRKRKCWSFVSFLSICLHFSTQELLLYRSSWGTLHYSLLEERTSCSGLCSSSPAWKGKRWEKKNWGSFPTWEEETGILTFQSLCYSDENFISLVFIFPRAGKLKVLMQDQSIWIYLKLKTGLPCPGYRIKLRFGDNGFSPAGNRTYYAVFFFCQHCIWVLYDKRCSALTLIDTVYISLPHKTEWSNFCLGRGSNTRLNLCVLKSVSYSLTNPWNNSFQLSLEFQLVNYHKASPHPTRQFERFALEMAVLQLNVGCVACEWKYFWFPSSWPWHK